MPINLNNLVTAAQKPSTKTLAPSYFFSELTGQKTTGLSNDTDASIKQNLDDYYTHNLINKMDGHNKNRYIVHDHDAEFIKIQYGSDVRKFKKVALSALDLLDNFDDDARNNFNHHAYAELPQTLQPKNMVELARTADGEILSVGFNINHVNRAEIQETGNVVVNTQIPAQTFKIFSFSESLIFRIERPHANKTNVSILSKTRNRLQSNETVFGNPKKHNQQIVLLDVSIPYLRDSNNISDIEWDEFHVDFEQFVDYVINDRHFQIKDADLKAKVKSFIEAANMRTLISEQAEVNQKYLFNDVIKLMDMLNGHSQQFAKQKALLSSAYDLIKLDEKTRTNQTYEIAYNQLKTHTLKRQSHKKLYKYTPYTFNRLISINTRLSLVNQISELREDKDVYDFVPKTTTLTTTDKYSDEQLRIIETTEPYSVGVAGAGSGKSHTLLGRLQFLEQNGIDLSKVLVTTFTNTGAKNIIDRFTAHINSLTNANLFHKIYQSNFSHNLTNDFTLSNLLQIIPESSKFMQSNDTINNVRIELYRLLRKSISSGFQKVDPRKITEKLILLINENLDDVIKLLDSFGQTSLLLEPIIINALMQNQSNIVYPTELQDIDFIITDESQDTSAFEYILLMQLSKLNHAQLMIIGDANQTLYEFRDANPEFLNALEKSDVFKNYTMRTNYRSNQSILLMANQILNILTTNETAKIQLHANQYETVDRQKFETAIEFENVMLTSKKASDNQQELTTKLTERTDFPAWVISQYQNHKQIAVLAYRNADTRSIATAVVNVLNTVTSKKIQVGYTRKQQPRPNTWLSRMVNNTQDSAFEKILNNRAVTMPALIKTLSDRLDAMINSSKSKYAVNDTWPKSVINDLKNNGLVHAKIKAFNSKKTGKQQLMGLVYLTLINAETQKNNVRQLLFQNDKDDVDLKDCDVVISSIHSAKGLEFDSTICYFDETSRSSTTQENLRLYGVALTRAKENELIINRPKVTNSTGNGNPTPTPYSLNEEDLFKTPMRTAYGRVKDSL